MSVVHIAFVLLWLFICEKVLSHDGHGHSHDHEGGHSHYHGLHTTEGTDNLIPEPDVEVPEGYVQPEVIPLHKFYSAAAGDHLYSTNEDFVKNSFGGYEYEGVACYVSPIPVPEAPNALGRFFAVEPFFDSFYTAIPGEIELIRTDENNPYKFISIAGYCSLIRRAGQCPLYRLYHNEKRDHFYTTSKDAPNTLTKEGWSIEGVACYVFCTDHVRAERTEL